MFLIALIALGIILSLVFLWLAIKYCIRDKNKKLKRLEKQVKEFSRSENEMAAGDIKESTVIKNEINGAHAQASDREKQDKDAGDGDASVEYVNTTARLKTSDD